VTSMVNDLQRSSSCAVTRHGKAPSYDPRVVERSRPVPAILEWSLSPPRQE
jgi:hypothetical protein